MILLLAVLAGLFVGSIRAILRTTSFVVPPLRRSWFLFIAVLPQLFIFYLPIAQGLVTDFAVAVTLVVSQTLLLLFGWWNRRYKAFWLLTAGLFCNLLVIVSNGGLMPMSPETLQTLISVERAEAWHPGERIGNTKDRLLLEETTNFAWLSDRFTLPRLFGYAVAYSFGDLLIAIGAFWFLWSAGGTADPA